MEPVYRLTVYDSDGSTPLTPIAGAPHTDAFQVASAQGVTGFEPYLYLPRGRRGRIDPLTGETDTGRLSLRVLDKRTSTGNASRFVTSFVGDDEGREQLAGKRALVEISTGGAGGSWSDYFTGRVRSVSTDGRTRISLNLWGLEEDLRRAIFVDRPHSSITYAIHPTLFPLANTSNYGPLPSEDLAEGEATDQGDRFELRPRFSEIEQNVRYGLSYNLLELARKDSGVSPHERGLRVRTSSGHYLVSDRGVSVFAKKDPAALLAAVRIETLKDVEGNEATSDPNHVALPTDGSNVDFDVIYTGPPEDGSPLVLEGHPVQIWKDILDGKFGRLARGNEDGFSYGDVTWSVGYDASAFSSLISDTSIPDGRWVVRESVEDAREWIEENICQPYGLAWRLDESGDVLPIDLRLPTSSAGLSSLDSDDVRSDQSPPEWAHTREDAIREFRATYYIESYIPDRELIDYPRVGTFLDVPPGRIEETEAGIVVATFGDPNLPDNDFHIDGTGYRAFTTSEGQDENILEKIKGQLRRRIEELQGPFGNGSQASTIPCRRTANVLSMSVGDLVIMDVDEIPNPASNLRGGNRIVRIVEYTEEGPGISLRVVDQGEDAVASTPSLGAASQVTGNEHHAAEVSVTLNGDGDRALVEYIVTDIGTGTRPADDVAGWTLADVATSTRTVTIPRLPSGSRVWIRARSVPLDTGTLKLASPWTYASNDSVDTDALSAPTGLDEDAGTVTTATARVNWTNTETDYRIEVIVDSAHVVTLPAGSNSYLLESLSPSTAYTVEVRYVDSYGGASATDSDGFTTAGGGNEPQAPTISGVAVLVGTRV